jgi:hypothetical protein
MWLPADEDTRAASANDLSRTGATDQDRVRGAGVGQRPGASLPGGAILVATTSYPGGSTAAHDVRDIALTCGNDSDGHRRTTVGQAGSVGVRGSSPLSSTHLTWPSPFPGGGQRRVWCCPRTPGGDHPLRERPGSRGQRSRKLEHRALVLSEPSEGVALLPLPWTPAGSSSWEGPCVRLIGYLLARHRVCCASAPLWRPWRTNPACRSLQ